MKKLIAILAIIGIAGSMVFAADTYTALWGMTQSATARSTLMDYNTYGSRHVYDITLVNCTTTTVLFDVWASSAVIGRLAVDPKSDESYTLQRGMAHVQVSISTIAPTAALDNMFMQGTTVGNVGANLHFEY